MAKFMIGDIVEFKQDYMSYKKGEEKFVYGVTDEEEHNIHYLYVDCGTMLGNLPQEWFNLKVRLRDIR